ncbi:MAG TPA: hypothetical protein PLQ35_16020 [bacterium]|nr:hypothetical protein [bacterium]HQL63787.1 hypothetical protein [bacterium]
MNRSCIYVETSIISYLSAKPSRDLPTAACQQVTSEWWENNRHKYDLYISELVIAEIKSGDPDAAARRLQA